MTTFKDRFKQIKEDKIKTKKELVQTYLIIATLLITIKSVMTTNQDVNPLESTVTYYTFLLFIASILLYYTRFTKKLKFKFKRDKIEFNEFVTDFIGISFGSFLYVCLGEPIIKMATNRLDLFYYSIFQIIPIMALAYLTKEAFDCQDEDVTKQSLARIIIPLLMVAFIISYLQMTNLKL